MCSVHISIDCQRAKALAVTMSLEMLQHPALTSGSSEKIVKTGALAGLRSIHDGKKKKEDNTAKRPE